MNRLFEPREVARLASAALDGVASADELSRLEEILTADGEARQFYYRLADLHAELAWTLGADHRTPTAPAVPQPAAAHRSPVLGFLASATRWVPGSESGIGALVILAVVAGFAGLVTAYYTRHTAPDPSDNGQTVARLIGSADAHWQTSDPNAPTQPSAFSNQRSEIGQGKPLTLASGTVALELNKGVRLLVEGPAEWSIDGGNNATLKYGKLQATVPRQATGFTLATPTTRIVDLGTEFSVNVAASGKTDLHVLRGQVEVEQVTDGVQGPSPAAPMRRLSAGQALRVLPGSREFVSIPYKATRLIEPAPLPATRPALPAFGETIPLGNLFEDPRGTPLAEAIKSDPFAVAPTSDSFGVERVAYGGDARQQIAPHLWFDFSDALWTDNAYGKIANDSVIAASPTGDLLEPLGIATRGSFSPPAHAKREDGIGMQANSLITFDLAEIREAADLPDDRPFLFRCDRIGIDDAVLGSRYHAAHMLAIVSSESSVLGAWVNGRFHGVVKENGAWRFTGARAAAPRATGRWLNLDLMIGTEARWLTLAVTDGGARRAGYSVWSGASLKATSWSSQREALRQPIAAASQIAGAAVADGAMVAAAVPGLLAHWEADDLPGPDGVPSAKTTFTAPGIEASVIAVDTGREAKLAQLPTPGQAISGANDSNRYFTEGTGHFESYHNRFGEKYYSFSVTLPPTAGIRQTLELSGVSAYLAHPASGRTGQYRFDYSTDGTHFIEGTAGRFENDRWNNYKQDISLTGIGPGSTVHFRLVLVVNVELASIRVDDIQVFGRVSRSE